MTREVLLSSPAQVTYEGLDPQVRARIRKALLLYASTGRGEVRRLRGVNRGPTLLRLRVGDYRIVFDQDPRTIRITRIIHRSEGYAWLA